MIEATTPEASGSWFSVIWSARHDAAARMFNVDLLAILVAALLPWSTTGTIIAVGLWVIALAWTVELRPLLRSLARPVSMLPIAMFGLALIGTLWSDASWNERLYAVGPLAKLLVLPLLFYHFERSPRGLWVLVAFLASCMLLMAVSWIVALEPSLSLKLYLSRGPFREESGIVVKNYIDQGQEFSLCAVALAYPIAMLLRANRTRLALLLTIIAASFVLNMMFVVISRTALVTMPIMLGLFALLHLKLRTTILGVLAAAVFAAVIWSASPHLRATLSKFVLDYEQTAVYHSSSGMGSRLEYWQKSLGFFAEAPVFGHGTGSTRGLFEKVANTKSALSAEIVSNPHNQTLNVAVQWGVIGVIVLYAMWLFHLLLFRGEGLANWIGLLVVVQNIFTSLLNSHLSDFHEGWMYVLGVGVAGGMTLGRLSHSQTVPNQNDAGQKQQTKHHIAEVPVA